jgi:SSS family solute:Na+ symporter
MITTVVVVLVIYFLAMVAIGWYGRHHSKDFESYLNMGRSGGILLLMGGCIGGQVGNGFVVGGAAEGASLGMAGAAYGLGCAGACFLVAFFLNDFIYNGNYMSLAQYCHKRYSSHIPGTIYDLSTAISSIGLIAGQIMAGKALFEALGLSGTLGAVAIAVVVLLYSQMSGLWGAFATSVIQTCVILAGLIVTTFVLLDKGALDIINAAIASGKAAPTALNFEGMSVAAVIGLVVPLWLGMITDQPTFQRVNSAKSAKISKLSTILSGIVMIPLALMPAFIGSYGAVEYGVSGGEAFFMVVLNELPAVVCALVIAAVIAAVMSTIDCGIITMSTVLTRDIWQTALGHNPDEKQLKNITLAVNVMFLGVSTVLALEATSIIGLLGSVYSFLAAACFVPFVGGIFWKKGNTNGAIAASIVGVATVIATWFGLSLPMASIFPILPSAVAYVIASLVSQDKYGQPARA